MLFRTTIVLLVVFVAGCAGPTAKTTERSVDVSGLPPAGEGAIVGHVTDAELLPIAMVAVSLVGSGQEPQMTDEAGAFRLEGMEPGEHSVQFWKFAFTSFVRPVRVTADNVTVLDVILEPVPVVFPFSKEGRCDGFLALDVATPAGASRGGKNFDKNDRNACTLPFAAGLSTVISHLSWDSGAGAAKQMELAFTFEKQIHSRIKGTSPLVGRLDDWGQRDSVHNLTQVVTLPKSSTEGTDGIVAVAYQQHFTLNTMFYYHGPAPEDAKPFTVD